MDEIYQQALKLLQRRDYTVEQLRQKLIERHGRAPQEVIDQLVQKRFLDDRRFAENLISKRSDNHPSSIRDALNQAGVAAEIADQAISERDWRSLQDVLKAKMLVWHLRAPLARRDVARLYRTLTRLGFPEDEIQEELEQLHEQ